MSRLANTIKCSAEVLALNPGLADDEAAAGAGVSPSKYHNTRTELKGLIFASGHEASVVNGLMVAEEQRADVFGLRLQVPFPLPGGIIYRADATYIDGRLQGHVVDAKMWDKKKQRFLLTKDFKMKAKLFLEKYGGRGIELL